MSKKLKMICGVSNYIEDSLTAISAITGCVSVSAFASFFGIPVGITSSAIGLKVFVMSVGIKKQVDKEKKRKRIMSQAKFKLNSIGVLISRALIDSNITHDEYVLINNC